MALIQAKTENGVAVGCRGNNQGYTVFRGIPYAAAPVGERRFAPPLPAESWQGERLFDKWPHCCVQEEGSFGHFTKEFYPAPKDMDEDCLYLNVWTPAEDPAEKLPVFFWIHGGGYGGGYSYEMEFDGEAMCKRGCILVTIQYRCNAFGFFAHPELTAKHGHSGNQGMLDQIAALGWVRRNIAAFGGDPENITVHGQSAGAMSTKTLLTSPLCRGMMNRVIIQSGGGLNDWNRFRTQADKEALGIQMLQTAGMTFAEAMTLPAKEVYARLAKAAQGFSGGMGDLIFHPGIDNYALYEETGASIAAGKVNTDCILCGSVSGDAGLQAARVEGVEPSDHATAFAPTVAMGRQIAQAGGKPIYGYYFDRDLPGDNLGAWHSAELWYMFGTLHRCWRPWTGYDYVLSDAMVDYWCNFAKTGDPNGPGLPAWPTISAEAPYLLMHFGNDGFAAEDLVRDQDDWRVIDAMSRK